MGRSQPSQQPTGGGSQAVASAVARSVRGLRLIVVAGLSFERVDDRALSALRQAWPLCEDCVQGDAKLDLPCYVVLAREQDKVGVVCQEPLTSPRINGEASGDDGRPSKEVVFICVGNLPAQGAHRELPCPFATVTEDGPLSVLHVAHPDLYTKGSLRTVCI
jgi:hypothetical protein